MPQPCEDREPFLVAQLECLKSEEGEGAAWEGELQPLSTSDIGRVPQLACITGKETRTQGENITKEPDSGAESGQPESKESVLSITVTLSPPTFSLIPRHFLGGNLFPFGRLGHGAAFITLNSQNSSWSRV